MKLFVTAKDFAMDLSKMKIEVYDFLAVIIPGLLLLFAAWIALRGWALFAQRILSTDASAFAIVLLLAFAVGTILQEATDFLIKATRGERYFKSGRDRLWESTTGERVRTLISDELGHPVEHVDVAFDYCLTRLQGRFSKRDLFVAQSDFARGLMFVSCSAAFPLLRVSRDLHARWQTEVGVLSTGLILLFLISCLCWKRMKRFRELSEKPVFHAYLAQLGEIRPANLKKGC
jgi:hypothetical protein